MAICKITCEVYGGEPFGPFYTNNSGDVLNWEGEPVWEGHFFDMWFYDEAFTISFVPWDIVETNITVYASWYPSPVGPYTLTYDTKGGSSISPVQRWENKVLIPTHPTKSGYIFGGWYPNSDLSGTQVTSSTSMGSANKTIYAKWVTEAYYFYFYDYEHATVTPKQLITSTTVPALPVPTTSDYVFDRWYNEGYPLGTTIQSGYDYYLMANWRYPRVYFNSNGGAYITDTFYEEGTLGILPTPVRANYTFTGWYNENSPWNKCVSYSQSQGDLYLRAQWTDIKYTLTYNPQSGSVSPASATISAIVNKYPATLPTPTRSNYNFGGWYTGTNGSGTKIVANTTFVGANQTIYAKWTVMPILTYQSNGGTTYSKIYTNNIVFPASNPTRTNYTFVGWYTNIGLTTAATNGAAITSNTTIYAKWANTTYQVTFNSNGGLNVSPITVAVLPTPLPGTTRSNYTFSGWCYDLLLRNPASAGDLITSITTLYADWARIPYTLTYIPQNGQSTTSTTVYADSQVYPTLPTPARANYTLKGWYTAASGGTKIYAGNSFPSSNTTIYAQWTEITYTLTYNPQGGSVSPTSATIYAGTNKNYPSTLPTPARTNYNFKGWYTASSGGSLIVAGSGFPSSNTTIYAQWTIMPILTYNSNGGTTYSTIYTNNIVFPSPNPTRANYIFGGWYINSNFATAATNGSTILTNTTIYAKWTEITYTLTYDARGGNTPSPTTIYATNQIYPSLPSSARTNYNFNGWYTAASGGYQITAGNGFPSSNTTIYAKWTVMPILTYQSNGGTTYSKNIYK